MIIWCWYVNYEQSLFQTWPLSEVVRMYICTCILHLFLYSQTRNFTRSRSHFVSVSFKQVWLQIGFKLERQLANTSSELYCTASYDITTDPKEFLENSLWYLHFTRKASTCFWQMYNFLLLIHKKRICFTCLYKNRHRLRCWFFTKLQNTKFWDYKIMKGSFLHVWYWIWHITNK